jgi:hypothetical protein
MTIPQTSGIPQIGTQQLAEAMAQLQRLSRLRSTQQRRPLTEDEQRTLDEQQPCMHCGGYHARACPRVKLLEWHPNGHLAKAEYWPDDQVDWEDVIFPDQGEDESDGMVAVARELLDRALSPYGRLQILNWPTWKSQREAAEEIRRSLPSTED